MKIALTDLAIQKLKSDQQMIFWDTTTPNFGIRCMETFQRYHVRLKR